LQKEIKVISFQQIVLPQSDAQFKSAWQLKRYKLLRPAGSTGILRGKSAA